MLGQFNVLPRTDFAQRQRAPPPNGGPNKKSGAKDGFGAVGPNHTKKLCSCNTAQQYSR